MLGQGRIKEKRILLRTLRLSCLSKRRGSFSRRGGKRARDGMSLPRFESQHWAAVANGSRLHTKGTRTCPEFGHRSIQMQPTPPEFYANATEFCPEFAGITCQCKPQKSQFRSISHTHATQTVRISCQHRWWNGTQRTGVCGSSTDTEGMCGPPPHIEVHEWSKSTHRRCMCGGSPHMEGAGVEEVHTWRVQVWRKSTHRSRKERGSTKKTTLSDRPNTRQTTVSIDI